MDVVTNAAVLASLGCTAIWAAARVIIVLVVLRGTEPDQRPRLLRALAELYRGTPPQRASRRAAGPDDRSPLTQAAEVKGSTTSSEDLSGGER